MNGVTIRTIEVGRLRLPEGSFLVAMHFGGDEEYSAVWESGELAFADADGLKRTYRPAIILDRTGGAI